NPTASPMDWQPMSQEGAPSARSGFASVWTGTKWFIWSGILGLQNGRFVLANDGALYDPATDRWSAIATAGAPSARHSALAVWTGDQVLVWGGRGSHPDPDPFDGALYDPTKNEWTPLGKENVPHGRHYQSADWVNGRWYWLCGCSFNSRMNDGWVF